MEVWAQSFGTQHVQHVKFQIQCDLGFWQVQSDSQFITRAGTSLADALLL